MWHGPIMPVFNLTAVSTTEAFKLCFYVKATSPSKASLLWVLTMKAAIKKQSKTTGLVL